MKLTNRKTSISEIVSGKTVALVGPAESVYENECNGTIIDSYDIVARLNPRESLQDKDYAYLGTKTDLILTNNEFYRQRAIQGEIDGIPAYIVCPFDDLTIWYEIKEKYGDLLQDGKEWGPTSGIIAVYLVCISGAKEVYCTGFDFFRTADRFACGDESFHKPQTVEKKQEQKHATYWNNTLKDELMFVELLKEGYPILMDKVLEEIICTETKELF